MYFKLVTTLVGILMFAGLASAAPYAYIANNGDNTVSVVDTQTDEFVAKIPLGDSVGPFGVAISPDGKRVYVSNQISKTISVIDALSNFNDPYVINTIGPLLNTPSGLAISPAGTLYVANYDAASVSAINVANLPPNTTVQPAVTTIFVETNPTGVAIDKAGKVYVTNSGSNSVSIIDPANNNTVSKVAVQSAPMGIATSMNGDKVFVANSGSNSVSVITTYNGSVTNITQNIGTRPYGVAVDGGSGLVYVSNSGASGGDTVSVIDPANNTVTRTYSMPAGLAPQSIAVTRDGLVYAVNDLGAGSISMINTKAETPAGVEIKNPDNFPFFSDPTSFGNFIGPQLYMVTAQAGSNGTISPEGDNLVGVGSAISFSIKPNAQYRINNITVDGTIISDTDPKLTKVADSWIYTFDNVNATHSIDVTFIKDFDYVSITRKGPGAVFSSQGSTSSINCSASTDVYLCNALFQEGTEVTLTAVPDPGKFFVRWTGDTTTVGQTTVFINNGQLCDGKTTRDSQNRPECKFSMTTYTHFTAEFSDTPVGTVRMMQQGSIHATLQSAFDAANGTTTDIQASAPDYPENLILQVNAAFTLSTGWDSGFQTKGTPSTITGSLTIANGTITADSVVIK